MPNHDDQSQSSKIITALGIEHFCMALTVLWYTISRCVWSANNQSPFSVSGECICELSHITDKLQWNMELTMPRLLHVPDTMSSHQHGSLIRGH
ncbi:hypothetical protein GDO86_013869 [Hymenochirus boettgeri]|uniref:Uncharacterized protein n=1 Tax=Hymenochirus boettgeri TaxID=247094 RepID=A0A8T2JS40_9PIPI|nr:hypothetical protein GDO86_013869 [Hymenochirus boettgeri]